MTVNANTSKAGPYLTNGSTTVFPFSFPFTDTDQIKVLQADLATGAETELSASEFTVSTPGLTGTVTLTTVKPAGYSITILRETDQTQEADLENQGGWFPEVHESVFDKITMMVQEVNEKADRALKIPASSTADPNLPAPVAGTVLGSTDGHSFENLFLTDAGQAIAGNWNVDRFQSGVGFTGGVTTQLTLTKAPASLMTVLVTFDGVIQHISTFTLSNKTLTFSSAIPVGVAEVEVRIPVTLAVAQPDGEILASGSSYPRSLSSRFAESANVKDFGALGDGANDDSLAFTAALATGRPVYVPSGTYKITGVILGPSSPGIFGNGGASVISPIGNTTGILVDANARFIDGLAFVGSGKASGLASQLGLKIFGTTYNGYRTRISNCVFKDFQTSGLWIQNTTDIGHMDGVSVTDCQFLDCGAGMQNRVKGEYVTTTACLVHNCTTGIYSDSGNNNLVGCKLVNCDKGLHLANGANDSHGIASGCQFNHCTYPIYCDSAQYGFVFVGCAIFEGTVYIHSSPGVHIKHGFLDVTHFDISNSTGVVIEGNINTGGYANTPTNLDAGWYASRVQWRANRSFYGAMIAGINLTWQGQIEGGYVYALGNGGTINHSADAVLTFQPSPTNALSHNTAYTGDTFCNAATGEITSKGYGRGHVTVKIQQSFTGAGTLALAFMDVLVDGVSQGWVPASNVAGTYAFVWTGYVKMNADQKLTFKIYNSTGNTITMPTGVHNFVEVEGL